MTLRAAVLSLVACAAPALAQSDLPPLDQLIADSLGYVQIADGLVMIEGDQNTAICRIDAPDAFFNAYARGDRDAIAAAKPMVICVPIEEFTN